LGAVVLAVLMIASTAAAGVVAQEELPDDYIPFTFSPSDSGLVGSSEFLAGFTITMDIPLERFPDGLELDALYSAVRDQQITGTVTYPSGRVTPIAYEMVRHRGPEEIYMKSSLGYFLWEHVSVTDHEVRMAIYWWYCPPTRPADRAALEMAAQLLADPGRWHQEDDRDCADDAKSHRWSLFCALKHASIKTMGEYNHHNTAMQTVRFVIDERIPEHGFAHTLMDFNNATTTTHADILHVLEQAHERIESDLAETKSPSDPDGN
jgi:hypothetical protein